MPALAQRMEQTEAPRILSIQLRMELDACTEIRPVCRNKLKVFLERAGIRSITEMDYPLRQAFEEYLLHDQGIRHPGGYLKAYDRVKQYAIRKQMATLAGRRQCRWEMNDTVLFIPYHPDQSLAMEFDFVRNRRYMVWDFTIPCSQTVKKQIFTVLNVMLAEIREVSRREPKLSGLQAVYGFCAEEGIEDIEQLDAEQIRHFGAYLDREAETPLRKELLRPSLDFCLRTLFLRSPEINWNANVWYLERLHLQEHRVNPGRPVETISFREISMPRNRQYLKDYMRYQFGIADQAAGTIHRKHNAILKMLAWFSGQGWDVSRCTPEQMEDYIRILDEQGTAAETFNDQLTAIHQFFCFLITKGHMERVPFCMEYHQKKVIRKHLDRSVSPDTCMEILARLPLLPEHLRCMYLHLWCLGLRISEVCALKGDAYERVGQDTWIKVYQTKTKTYKRIPIAEGLYKIMQVYRKRNGIGPDDYLFQNRNGGAYRVITFICQMKEFCLENDVDGGEYVFQSHGYRHTVATFLYDNEVSLQGVRDYLGHDYEEMTEQYIDHMPGKIAKENDAYFRTPGNSLAAGLKKGGSHGR